MCGVGWGGESCYRPTVVVHTIGFLCVLVNYRPLDAAKSLPVRLFPLCFFALPRKCSQYAHRWFCALFCVAKRKEKKKKEQKIFMFEKIDSLFVVVVAINRTTASVISGILIFIL